MGGEAKPTVRPARPEDRAFVLGLVPRLEGFGSLPPYQSGQITSAVDRKLGEATSAPCGGSGILVAEGEDGAPLGFVRVKPQDDYFTGEKHGYVSELAVAEENEGAGVGRALLEAAEDWARDRGYRMLTLDVFAPNRRARTFYKRAGYGEDSIKMVKEL